MFRLGELHIVFAMLKVLGKYIDDSGLDKLFIEAGVYGSTTLRQILEGKHMKRGVEAHVTMYVALSRRYFLDWYRHHKEECSEDIDEIEQELSYFTNLSSDKVDAIKNTNTRLIHTIQDSGILKKLQNFGDSLHGQGRFLRNYMDMCESLLLFIRSSRQGHWNLRRSYWFDTEC